MLQLLPLLLKLWHNDQFWRHMSLFGLLRYTTIKVQPYTGWSTGALQQPHNEDGSEIKPWTFLPSFIYLNACSAHSFFLLFLESVPAFPPAFVWITCLFEPMNWVWGNNACHKTDAKKTVPSCCLFISCCFINTFQLAVREDTPSLLTWFTHRLCLTALLSIFKVLTCQSHTGSNLQL